MKYEYKLGITNNGIKIQANIKKNPINYIAMKFIDKYWNDS